MAAYFKRIVVALALLLAVSLSSPPAGAGAADAEPKPQSPPATESAAPASTPQRGNTPPQINGDSIIAAGNELDSPLTAKKNYTGERKSLEYQEMCGYSSRDTMSHHMLVRKILKPNNESVETVVTELCKCKSEYGKIVTFGNTIYVEDTRKAMKEMVQVFARLDHVVRDILIEARFVESSAAFADAFDFQTLPRQDSESIGLTEQVKLKAFVLKKDDSKSLGDLINNAENAFWENSLHAATNAVWARQIFTRGVQTSDGSEISINNNSNYPFKRESSGASTTVNASFRERTIELKITPHIEENEDVLALDISFIGDAAQPDDNDWPPDSAHHNARTKIIIHEGETLAIGGISTGDVKSETGRDHERILPVKDWMPLYGRYPNNDHDLDIIIFITATIVPLKI